MHFGDPSAAETGAFYSSVKTQGDALFRKARYKDALTAYDEAFSLNPRSKTILLSRANCLTQMGQFDQALRETDKAGRLSGTRRIERKPFPGWNPKNTGRRQKQNTTDGGETESPGDLTYKCRYLLSKADALFNKGDFEGALVFYHKGQRLRPHSDEFRIGILKSEEALETLFSSRQIAKKTKKRLSENAAAGTQTERSNTDRTKKVKQDTHISDTKSEKGLTTRDNKSAETETKTPKTDKSSVNNETGNQQENVPSDTNKESDKTEDTPKGKADDATQDEDQKEEKENDRTSQAPSDKAETASQKPSLPKPEPPYHLDRKERIREMRLTYAIREREEARRTRAKMQMLTRPTVHLNDDKEFLQMLYKDFFSSGTKKEKRVRKVAKDALNYLDTRNKFWKQQAPHHLREKSTLLGKTPSPTKTGPPPTQALYKFVIKEMMRINNMLDKGQFHRAIDNAKKLIEHINNMDKSVPNKFNILANLFSIIGQGYLELGDHKKSIAFHMKDLELATQHDLDHAKSRALDNTGRVFARIGEFAKAIAVWEEKLLSPIPIPPSETAWLCHELGYCYIEIEDFAKAKESGEKALKAAEEAKDKQWQLNASTLIAQSTLNMGEAVQARDAFSRALKFAIELKDDKAKESIEPALEELNKVIEQWEKDGENGNGEPPTQGGGSTTQPESDTKPAKPERSQSDWLLGDSTKEGNVDNKRETKAAESSESEADTKKKRLDYQEVYATYVGGKDSDFYITPSGESSGEDKQGKPTDPSARDNNTDTETPAKTPVGSDSKPQKSNQSSKSNDKSQSRTYNNGAPMKREVSFSRSPNQSPTRTMQRERSFAGKPRRENSFVGKPKRENSFARPPRREKSNVSSRTNPPRIPLSPQDMNPPPVSSRRKKPSIILDSKRYRSTDDLSQSAGNSRERRNSVSVGIGGKVL